MKENVSGCFCLNTVYILACAGYISRFLHESGSIRGRAIEWWQKILPHPRPTPVAMATKIFKKYSITRLLRKISPRFLHTAGCFRGRAIEWCKKNSTTTNPCCNGNDIWDKIDYNAICIEISPRYLHLVGGCLSLAIEWWQKNLPRLSTVAMATKIWHKIGSM